MAFVPLPVHAADDEKLHVEQHEGFRLMDEFFKANETDRTPEKDMAGFVDFLLNTVVKNIVASPDEAKFRRLKKSAKAMEIVKRVKLGAKLLEYMGFRDRVEEMQNWVVLRTDEDEWLEMLQRRADLVRRQWEKRREAEEIEARGAAAKAAADKRHKDQLLARIHEERKDRNSK